MKKLVAIIMSIVIMVLAMPIYASAATVTPSFKDIRDSHWAKPLIVEAAEKGWVSGYPDGTFRPDDRVNVDEFIAMMLRSLTSKKSDGKVVWSSEYFSKLDYSIKAEVVDSLNYYDPNAVKSDTNYWADPYLAQAERMLFFKRVDTAWGGKFNVQLTREKAAYLVMSLVAWMEHHENPMLADLAWANLKDKDKTVFETHVIEAYIKGIISGYPDKTFRPKGYITRAESIALISRILDKSKRESHIPDLTGKNYTTVKLLNGDTKYYVFPDASFNKLFDSLQAVKDTAPAGSHLVDGRVMLSYFTNKSDYDRMVYESDRDIYDFQPDVLSVGLGASDRDFGISVNTDYGMAGYEKIYDTFVNTMFESKADQFKKIFQDKLAERKKNGTIKVVDMVLNGREIHITTVGYAGVAAYISAKQ